MKKERGKLTLGKKIDHKCSWKYRDIDHPHDSLRKGEVAIIYAGNLYAIYSIDDGCPNKSKVLCQSNIGRWWSATNSRMFKYRFSGDVASLLRNRRV